MTPQELSQIANALTKHLDAIVESRIPELKQFAAFEVRRVLREELEVEMREAICEMVKQHVNVTVEVK